MSIVRDESRAEFAKKFGKLSKDRAINEFTTRTMMVFVVRIEGYKYPMIICSKNSMGELFDAIDNHDCPMDVSGFHGEPLNELLMGGMMGDFHFELAERSPFEHKIKT